MNDVTVTVAVLAYNEGGNIAEVVREMRSVTEHVLVVDDGSTDLTAVRAEVAGAEVYRRNTRGGYGAAVKTALLAVSTDWVCVLDGDGQFRADSVWALIQHQRQTGADAVWGVRVHRADSWLRKLTGWAWREFTKLLFGVRVRDVDCGAKLFRSHAIPAERLRSMGAAINPELWCAANAAGLVVRECEVSHYPRTSGTPKGLGLRVALEGFLEALKAAQRYSDQSLGRRIVRFIVGGLLNTAVDLATFGVGLVVLRPASGAAYGVLALAAYGVGGIVGYVVSQHWTFPDRVGKPGRYLLQVAALAIVNAAVFMALASFLSHAIALTLLSKLFAQAFTAVVSFALQSGWVFKLLRRDESHLSARTSV